MGFSVLVIIVIIRLGALIIFAAKNAIINIFGVKKITNNFAGKNKLS